MYTCISCKIYARDEKDPPVEDATSTKSCIKDETSTVQDDVQMPGDKPIEEVSATGQASDPSPSGQSVLAGLPEKNDEVVKPEWTLAAIEKEWRKFNIDLMPKVLNQFII